MEHIAPDAEYECEQLNDSTTYLCQEQSSKSTTKITFAGFLPEDNKKKLSEKELSEQRIKKIDKQIAPLKGQTFKDCDAVEKQAKTLISKDMKKYFTCKCTDWDDEMNATDGKFSYNCSDGYLQTGVMGTLTKSDKKQSIKESLERVLENGAFHWNESLLPPVDEEKKEPLSDPQSLYQIVSILQGAVERGTGKQARVYGHTIAGKTGTTNQVKDVWFVGFSKNLIAGVYLGYDIPKPLGAGAGSHMAARVFADFMTKALQNESNQPFTVPDGMTFIRVNRNNGVAASQDSDGMIINEVFKPGQTPNQPRINGNQTEKPVIGGIF